MSAIERMTVTVPAALAATVRHAVAVGDYGSTSEVVREALDAWVRSNDADHRDADGVRDAIHAGLASGPGIPVETVFAELHARYAAQG